MVMKNIRECDSYWIEVSNYLRSGNTLWIKIPKKYLSDEIPNSIEAQGM